MSSVLFFKKKNILINKVFINKKFKNNFLVNSVKPLDKAQSQDITFFDSIKYKTQASQTKASVCITTLELSKYLPAQVEKVISKNVLFELAKTLKIIFPQADIDHPDFKLKKPNIKKFKSVKFGNNVLVGSNVKIGKKSEIGSNTIIESNVIIGKECVIGSNTIIKNTIIGNKVVLQDNCKIGLKGFGFIPNKKTNFKIPHIGKVIINDEVEIASGCTIDRGSVDDTVIGKNTYIDNQVHIAHNVKIGSNCMIAGQVGFAGSSVIGNNVSIGGQAGISGHLKIGNDVKIGGGSGVVKNIDDNQIVMGYPALPLKDFLKRQKS